jgi:hypothetical protein
LILITAWKPSSGQYVFQFMRQVVDSDEVMPMTIRAPIRCCVVVIAATTLLVAGSPTVNAAEAPALPRSALPGVEAIESIEHREMPPVDVAALLREDALREASARPVAPRFAKDLAVDLTLNNSGTWETLDDGSRLWRIRLSSPGALSINLGLDVFDLPGSASFWVQAPDGSWVQGPYTRDDRNSRGGLWTAVVPGDEVVAELQVPEDSDARLEIKSVNHGYRFFGEHKDSAANKRGSCNINVVCPDGLPWRNEIRSVARITVLGMYLCTGQLLNNTAEDLTPYLLTAQHCVEQAAEAPSIVAYWNFQSPACDDFAGGNLSQNQSGSTFVSSWDLGSGSDFTLVELDQEPRSRFNVYYSGWDARDQIPESTTTIHHPSGDEKSISFDFDPPTVTSYLDDASPGDGNFFRIGAWDQGTTEGGSSGSCIYDDASNRCIGTLSGGFASCTHSNEPDWYGRLSAHWTGDGTPETRLSDWLDPLDSGALFLDGKDGPGAGAEDSWLIPAVASLPGVPPTEWKSQIGVVNPTGEERSASIYYVEKGKPWPGRLLSGPHTIGANESLYLDDPLLPDNPTSGLLYVTVNGTGTAVYCRTLTPAPGGGTNGQGQPGILLSSAQLETQLILPLIHSSPGVFRTNVGFSQTSAGAIQFRVQIYSAAGELLAQKDYTQSAAWRQINDIFANMGIGGRHVEGGWIRVTLISGLPSYWTTYATVIDDTTSDPTYILPVAP